MSGVRPRSWPMGLANHGTKPNALWLSPGSGRAPRGEGPPSGSDPGRVRKGARRPGRWDTTGVRPGSCPEKTRGPVARASRYCSVLFDSVVERAVDLGDFLGLAGFVG